MQLKTVQWNIGGGKILTKGADPTLLRSYREEGIGSIIDFLRNEGPDIVTLQETHSKGGSCQPQQIAEALAYKYWVNDEWADSHVEAGYRLGQGIVSRFPLTDHSFEFFNNPHFQAVWEDGSIATSHDKGRTRCLVELPDGQHLTVQTLHTVPFRRYHIPLESDEAKTVLADMSSKLLTGEVGILQSDFNLDAPSLRTFFPSLFEGGFQEIVQPVVTTPKGNRYDHILYLGLKVVLSRVIDAVGTDHYPIVTVFELAKK